MIDEPGLPGWAVRFRLGLKEALERVGLNAPTRLFWVATAADLPDPIRYRGHTLYAVWIARTAVSDGVHWKRMDTGANL